MKNILLTGLLVGALLLTACQSVKKDTASEQKPEKKSYTSQDDSSKAPKESKKSAEDGNRKENDVAFFKQVKGALIRAEEVNADRYAPDLMKKARDDFERFKALRGEEGNRAEAEKAGQSVILNADRAYEQSLSQIREGMRRNLDELDRKLLKESADKYMPEDYAEVRKQKDEVLGLLDKSESQAISDQEKNAIAVQYRSAQSEMEKLLKLLQKNLRWVRNLRKDIDIRLGKAEEQEAYLWAEKDLDKANKYYNEGLEHLKLYHLQVGEKRLRKAYYWAGQAVENSALGRNVNEVDQMMNETRDLIEKASDLEILTNSGEVKKGKKWTGDTFLKENPLKDLRKSKEATDQDLEKSGLSGLEDEAEQPKADSPEKSSKPESDRSGSSEKKSYHKEVSFFPRGGQVPLDGKTRVLGDEQEFKILEQAKLYWKKGIEARNNEEFEMAKEYFRESKAFADAYKNYAVTSTYKVRFRKPKTDSLWSIAGYKGIYKDPFLWPKIWRRNKKIIQNPDLIYPGQILVIPPH